MNKRLLTLDGLRGFAAISVVIGHSGYALPALIPSSILLFLYQSISAGSSAVQILFVLSGFLIATLYPSVPDTLQFIQKRYLRIFPVYAVIVFSMWLIVLNPNLQVSGKLATVLMVALCGYIGWRGIKKSSKIEFFGKTLFWLFVVLQISMLVINLFVITQPLADLPKVAQNVLLLLSNLTLTTPFSHDTYRLISVFWSLAPEVLFYLLYPCIGIPLILVSKKYGFLMSLIVIIGVTKIMFDLDYTVVSTATLQNMNIARASGFVAGVTIGVIYQSRGVIWNKIQPVLSSRICSLIALIMLFALQGVENNIQFGHDIIFLNTYFTLTSWIIGFVLLTSICSRSLLSNVFSSKFFVFLGLISYSLYLSHSLVGEWLKDVSAVLTQHMSYNKTSVVLFFIVCITAIMLAAVLFYLIERIYFESRKLTNTQVTHRVEVQSTNTPRISWWKIISVSTLIIGVFFFLYCDYFPPTVLIHRNPLSSSEGRSLLYKDIDIPFSSYGNGLSDVYLHLRYVDPYIRKTDNHPKIGVLHIKLLDEHKKTIATFEKRAYSIITMPFLKIHIPTIHSSIHKNYILEMSLIGGGKYDQVFIDTHPGMTSVYHDVHNPLSVVVNRVFYVLGNDNFIFASIFILFIAVSYGILSPKQAVSSKTCK